MNKALFDSLQNLYKHGLSIAVLLTVSSLGLLSCHRGQPEPYVTVADKPTPPSKTFSFPNFPLEFDFFSDLPTAFPESEHYRVSGIDVSGVDKYAPIQVRFAYNEQGQLAFKSYYDYRFQPRSWRHNYTFDAKNRLIREESFTANLVSDGEYNPVQIDYTYEGDKLIRITKKTSGGTNYGVYALNLLTDYQYEGLVKKRATILSYYAPVAVGNVPYPVDSIRRQFIYLADDQTTLERDSVWSIPCYPNMACINQFLRVDQTQKQVDAKNNLLDLTTSIYAYLYPGGKTTFINEYEGPEGLLSQRTNGSAGLVYRFIYQKK